MIRIPNSGTDLRGLLKIIAKLYRVFGQSSFTLEEMSAAMAEASLLTSGGFAHEKAIESAARKTGSKRPDTMNAKMYVEVIRLLGWLGQATPKAAYPISITFWGQHIVKAVLNNDNCSPLFEACMYGVVYPNKLATKTTYNESTRLYKAILEYANELNGFITTKELCIGPMSHNDDKSGLLSGIAKIRKMRAAQDEESEWNRLVKELNKKENTVKNYTRIPIAYIVNTNLFRKGNTTVYGRKRNCFYITEKGKKALLKLRAMQDIRLSAFQRYKAHEQKSLIRLGFYSMLDRLGYDTSEYHEIMEKDKAVCKQILTGSDILFSPYQTVDRLLVDEALGYVANNSRPGSVTTKAGKASIGGGTVPATVLKLSASGQKHSKAGNQPIEKRIQELHKEGKRTAEIVRELTEQYKSSNKNVFYPLIAELFCCLGLPCRVSRAGDNGSRWDALIEYDGTWIPVEIKSPDEDEFIPVKAIRQALENKVVLLSRYPEKSDTSTTSLAVGYALPRERAAVNTLVQAINSAYGYNIGVIDFPTLLRLASAKVIENKTFSKDKLQHSNGIIS